MSALDFAARGLIAQARQTDRRLATIDMISRGIAENTGRGLPGLIDVPITESRSSTTQIASGTTYGFSSSTAASNFPHHYSMYGGEQTFYDTTSLRLIPSHNGNGSDPSANPNSKTGAVFRFQTFADQFEIYCHNYLGFRVRVNGKYLQTGMYGVQAINGDTAGSRFYLFDFTGTEFAGAGLKQVEIIPGADYRFKGVRVPIAYTVAPWPQALPIKAALHGDSMPDTVSDTGTDARTSLHGLTHNIVQALTGLPEIWNNANGSVGFVVDASGTKSTFGEQATIDFTGTKFDLVWEIGGRNDSGSQGSAAAYQAVVEAWIDTLLADNPDMLIILTGPITVQNSEGYQSSTSVADIQNGKKAAAASYPRNCAFIETAGNAVTNDPWIFGTGKQGATTGNGNADLVRGNDGTHLTVLGHQYLGSRIVAETARVLPLLASRIRDGVIEGVNDGDLS